MTVPGSEFDRDTAVRGVGEDGSSATYALDLAGHWAVGGGLNGGYLLAALGRAIAQTTGPPHPDPLTISAYYLSAGTAGPATARVEVLRRGRGQSTVRATLAQDVDGEARDRLTVLATYADLGTLDPEVATTATPPVLPPREDCVPTSDGPAAYREAVPLVSRMELRMDPATVGWMQGRPTGEAVMQAWVRLNDERDLDPLALLFVVDCLPPTLFQLGRAGWAPTVELTVHVRARPALGWAVVRHETRNLSGGYFEEDCEVWDAAGRLVAQGRQLAKVPRVAMDLSQQTS